MAEPQDTGAPDLAERLAECVGFRCPDDALLSEVIEALKAKDAHIRHQTLRLRDAHSSERAAIEAYNDICSLYRHKKEAALLRREAVRGRFWDCVERVLGRVRADG